MGLSARNGRACPMATEHGEAFRPLPPTSRATPFHPPTFPRSRLPTHQTLPALGPPDPQTPPPVASRPRLGAPIGHIGKFIAIGLNDADHAAESNAHLPEAVYLKPGDVMTLGIDNLGGQAQTVVAWEQAA